jgi:hypothetical protein
LRFFAKIRLGSSVKPFNLLLRTDNFSPQCEAVAAGEELVASEDR